MQRNKDNTLQLNVKKINLWSLFLGKSYSFVGMLRWNSFQTNSFKDRKKWRQLLITC
jgi:hypothetical protein